MDDQVFRRYSVAIVTPFMDASPDQSNNNGIQNIYEHPQALDFSAFEESINHVADGLKRLDNEFPGVIGGIIVSGSTGEQHSLSLEERQKLYAFAVQHCYDKCGIPVAAGVAAPTTAQAVLLAEAAMAAGCKGVLLGFPPYIRLSDPEMREYILAVRDVIPTMYPVLLYNNAARNGYGPSDALILELFRTGVICGMKYAVVPNDFLLSSSIYLLQQEPALRLYTGSDKLSLCLLDSSPSALSEYAPVTANGINESIIASSENASSIVDSVEEIVSKPLPRPIYYGLTSIMGNLYPLQMGRLVMEKLARKPLDDAASAISSASAMEVAMQEMMDEILLDCSLPVGVKYAMNIMGVKAGVCRQPLGHLSAEKRSSIRSAVDNFQQTPALSASSFVQQQSQESRLPSHL